VGYFLHVEVLVQDPSRNLPLKALTRAAGAFLEELPEPQVATAAYENGGSRCPGATSSATGATCGSRRCR
jgi:hypothetical protein